MIDPKLWNQDITWPTPDKPLYFIYRGFLPSLKNDRDIGVTKEGRRYSRPKKEVTEAIAGIRDALDRQLSPAWKPIAVPHLVNAWLVLGAHAVTSIPDADTDNMMQTLLEALAMPRQKEKLPEAKRTRLIVEDDRQFGFPAPYRRAFADKTRIYHRIVLWVTEAKNEYETVEELSHVAKIIQRGENDATDHR